MGRRVLMWVVILLGIAVSGWMAYGGLLWYLQEAILFPAPGGIPRSSLDEAAAELGIRPVELTSADGTRLYGWHRPARGERVVFYLHGNAETVASSLMLQRWLTERGWDTFVLAYRGYPGSEGKPGEAGILDDAEAAFAHLVGPMGFAPERVVLHGKSLGGGVALGLATRVEPAALVLESTFTSVRALAAVRAPLYPVDRLLRHPFRSDVRAARIHVPTLVLHGAQDELIPVSHGRHLAEIIDGAVYVESPWLGHNDALVLQHEASREAYLALLEAVPRPGEQIEAADP